MYVYTFIYIYIYIYIYTYNTEDIKNLFPEECSIYANRAIILWY